MVAHLVDSLCADDEIRTVGKFDRWDCLKNIDILSASDNEKSEFFSLLQDPTIYAYGFWLNKESAPFELYSYQDMIINDPHDRILFVASNQIGKSVTLCLKAIHYALHNPGKTVLMCSKTLPQAKDLLREIKRLLRSSTLDYHTVVGDSDTKTEIYFQHLEVGGKSLPQSRIICVPATEAALGYPADLLLIDELAFYDDGRYFFYQIAQPRTYATKGQIIVFSNPNGAQGILWDLWNAPGWHRYNFNFLDCPRNSLKDYETLRSQLTVEEFDSTVDAKFTSPSGAFLTLDQRRRIQDENLTNTLPAVVTSPFYVFFDFAKAQDRTVRVIGSAIEKKGDDEGFNTEVLVHEMKEYPQGTSYKDIIDDLKALLLEVGFQNIMMVGWDNTGVGKGLEDFIVFVENVGIMTQPVEFSLQNKSRIYTLFKLLVENDRIRMPYVPTCDQQLAALRFEKSGSKGYLRVKHQSERDRDDFPDSLSGLCSLIIAPLHVPVTCEVI